MRSRKFAFEINWPLGCPQASVIHMTTHIHSGELTRNYPLPWILKSIMNIELGNNASLLKTTMYSKETVEQ